MSRVIRFHAFVMIVVGMGVALASAEAPVPARARSNGDDVLRLLLARSDVVVTGELVSVGAESREAGVHHYRVEVKVDGVIKGDSKNNDTIVVGFIREEPTPNDVLPIIKEKNRAILFLQKPRNAKIYSLADPWFGFQHPQGRLIEKLRELAKAE